MYCHLGTLTERETIRCESPRSRPTETAVRAPRLGYQINERLEVNQQVERRRCDRDPIDVLTPEVFALLKLCGAVRAGDIERDRPDRAPRNRHDADRRESVEADE